MPSHFPFQPHNDYLLYRFQNGIKLRRPDRYNQSCPSLKKVLDFPINVYFTDGNGLIRKFNDSVAHILQLSSVKDAIGKSLFEVTSPMNAKILRNNDLAVIDSQQIKFFDEQYIKTGREEKIIAEYFTVKTPWYDEEDNIIGIFGCSIPTNTLSWSKSLLYLQQLDLLNTKTRLQQSIVNIPTININDVYITKREKEILFYLARYQTAKRVAAALNISYRTAEMHIANLKNKFQVRSKSDLVDLVIELKHH